jgi:hypothetical protein
MKRRTFLIACGTGLAEFLTGGLSSLLHSREQEPNSDDFNISTFLPIIYNDFQEPITDDFNRVNGAVGNDWIGSSWSIRSNKAINIKPLTYSSQFMLRYYSKQNVKCGAAISQNWADRAGVVVKLDDPNHPQNYVVGYLKEGYIYLSQVLSQVETVLIDEACPAIDGELIEIRQSGTTYQLFYNGWQKGTDQTIDNPAINNNQYVGLYCNGGSFFLYFYALENGVDYNNIPPSAWTTATYLTGRGVLSLRFDDGPEKDYAITYQELISRGLVGGFAIIRNKINMAEHTTLAQIKTMQDNGMEIMCHSRTHVADPAAFAIFKDEAIVAGHEMRALKLDIASFVQPGTWVKAYPSGYDLGDKVYGSPADLALRANYWGYEAYANNFNFDNMYIMPRMSSRRYAANHLTGDQWSVADFKSRIDAAIAKGMGVEILFHAARFGMEDYITEADFQTFLDYAATKVSAGDLEVLTPTQQMYATPI